MQDAEWRQDMDTWNQRFADIFGRFGQTPSAPPAPAGESQNPSTTPTARTTTPVEGHTHADMQTDEFVPHIYDGNDDSCSICTQQFVHGERVCRLSCRHMFHAACWESFQTHHNALPDMPFQLRPDCPNCRGAGSIIAIWRYVDENLVTQVVHGQEVANELDLHASVHQINSPRGTSPSHTPRSGEWNYPVVDSETLHYHADTRLADGRPCLLLDIGSVGNLCGDKWAKEVAIHAAKHGANPEYSLRSKPLIVRGVGHGSQECHYECRLPIAFKKDGEEASIRGTINAPSIANSLVPGLMGLKAMEDNRTILDIVTGKIYFCGPGDYDLMTALPAGTDVFQMEKAPSGHLVLPCCEFHKPRTNQSSLTLVTSMQQRKTGGAPRTPPPSFPPVLPPSVNSRQEPPAP